MFIKIAESVFDKEVQALLSFRNQLSDEFNEAVDILNKVQGKICVSGIGKSGHIAKKISSTFSSIGSPSFFIHPSEANHGDLGMISDKECVILISNSGETPELSSMIDYCKKKSIPIIGITSQKKSSLAKASKVVLKIPENIEACPLDLAPTSSTTVSLVIGDALAVSLLKKNKFTKKDFGSLHPGGKIGKSLLEVQAVMNSGTKIPLIDVNKKMSNAILEMSSKGYGCVGVISNQKYLVGIITDGDLRRNMENNLLEKGVEDVMTKNPKTLTKNTLIVDAIKKMQNESITNLFVTDEKKPIGIIHIHDILKL
tara:strand:- start:5506 stop:6444 length:939 start_codon:yes stop_codon:yes gene_type:complete